jgi:hypothetical protein
MAADAIRGYLEVLIEERESIPTNKSIIEEVSVELP